jgi:hypothetical protein
MRAVRIFALVTSLGAACACQSDRAERVAAADRVTENELAGLRDQADMASLDEQIARDAPAPAAADGGASVAAAPGAAPTPIADGARFSPEITHPFLPLSLVRYCELRSDSERLVRAVADETEMVTGIECLVLQEQEFDGGELGEISYNYFAQDEQGNVWYFGEKVDEYDDGQVVAHGGAWMVGRNASEPCLIMPAVPTVGLRFKPENSPPDAEEFDEIAALDAKLTVPAGSFDGVLVVKEGDRPGEWKERKYYARGVGLISENAKLNLVLAR